MRKIQGSGSIFSIQQQISVALFQTAEVIKGIGLSKNFESGH
jgi:hypothetical protein